MPLWTLAAAPAAVAGAADATKTAADTAADAAAENKDAISQVIAEPVTTVTRWTDTAIEWAITNGPKVLGAIVLLFIAWLISRTIRNIVIAAMTRARIDLTLAKFFGNLAKWAVLAVAIIASLETFGFKTTSFAAVIGAAGLAIGLALQGNLGNLASGVMLLIFRPFKIGDAVVVAGQSGIVEGIDLFTTNLDTADNRRIIIPNGAVFGGVIENQTAHEKRCVSLSVPVNPGVPMDKIERSLTDAVMRVAQTTPGVSSDSRPGVALAELFPAMVWGVTLWVETSQFLAVRQSLLRELKSTIDSEGLAPPPPLSELRVVQLPGR